LFPDSSVTDSAEKVSRSSEEEGEEDWPRNKSNIPPIIMIIPDAMQNKKTLALREDMSLIKLDIIADIICLIWSAPTL
jgi:hypothetical protein